MSTVILTGVGRDRVGIVAEVAQVLYDLGGNLLDSSMTLLRGEFALILMVELPDGTSVAQLEAGLQKAERQLGRRIHARELAADELEEADNVNSFIVSVYGADRPGIVSGVTRALADLQINITDVQTKSTGKQNKLFVMILEVTAPPSFTASQFEQKMKDLSARMAVDITVRSLDPVEL